MFSEIFCKDNDGIGQSRSQVIIFVSLDAWLARTAYCMAYPLNRPDAVRHANQL
jgi:hypothetical protein